MRNALFSIFFCIFLIISPLLIFAGGPPPPPPKSKKPGIPIDGGISLLLAAGIAYGGKKIYDLGRKKN